MTAVKQEYRRTTLKYRILALFILCAIVIDFIICLVCGYAYSKSMKDEFIYINDSIVDTIANSISEYNINLWLSGKRNDEYRALSDKIGATKKSALDVEVLQIYKMNEKDMTVIVDSTARTVGETVRYPDAFLGIKEKLISGENVGAIFTDGGSKLISASPIKGNGVPIYVISKINMSGMKKERNDFMANIFLVTAIASILLIVILNFIMNHLLIEPLNKIDKNLRRFAEDNTKGEEVKKSLTKIKDYNIKEIARIKEDFVILCDDVGIKANEIKEFDDELIDRMKNVLKDYE